MYNRYLKRRYFMYFEVDVLFSGFSGKMEHCALGWGTWALVRDGSHNILFDTGGVGLRLNYENLLAKQGLACGDIDIVLLSHLHFDHACNVDLLPNAQFVLSKKEWEYANRPEEKDLFIQEHTLLSLRSAEKRFIEEDGEEIVPGITTLLTPGHTQGCLSFVLHQDNGEKWVLAGDAAKNRGELMTEEVQMTIAPEQTSRSIKKIKSTADRVLPGHDGWVTLKDGKIIPEGGNDVTLLFAQGVTVNGGQTSLTVHMD